MMLTFWLIAAVMSALVLLLLVPAMVKTPANRSVDQQSQDVEIARYRLAELDKARADGEISEDDYEASRTELEQALAQDLAQLERARERVHADGAAITPGAIALPVAIAFALPVAAGGLYLVVGEPGAIGMSARLTAQVAAGEQANRSVDVMMDQLKVRLAENPDDARGWSILARSSMQLGRYDDAALAFERLDALTPNEPDILVQYADALAMKAGGVLAGKPTELLDKALRINPDQPQGLWLSGMAAARRGEFELAMRHWNRLLPQLDGDPQSRTELVNLMRDLVSEARAASVALEVPDLDAASAASGMTATTEATAKNAAGGAALTVRVSLSEQLSGATSPSDTVFVFARAVDGPPMPLAAARRRVADLPFEVTLDDSQSMVPSMKLSAFDRVNVVARVSKTGQPVASSGDLEGMQEDVPTNVGDALEVVISRRVP